MKVAHIKWHPSCEVGFRKCGMVIGAKPEPPFGAGWAGTETVMAERQSRFELQRSRHLEGGVGGGTVS